MRQDLGIEAIFSGAETVQLGFDGGASERVDLFRKEHDQFLSGASERERWSSVFSMPQEAGPCAHALSVSSVDNSSNERTLRRASTLYTVSINAGLRPRAPDPAPRATIGGCGNNPVAESEVVEEDEVEGPR